MLIKLWHRFLKVIQPKVFIKITMHGSIVIDEIRNVPFYFHMLDDDEFEDIDLSVVIMTWRKYESLGEFTGF